MYDPTFENRWCVRTHAISEEKVVAKRKTSPNDSVVIYWSDEDASWIAHSLRTDQIGTGGRLVDALADVLKAIKLVYAEAKKDPTLGALREAPEEIQKMAETARKLPREIYEVAYKTVHGTWPEDWNPPEPKGDPATFTTQVEELAW